jgi:NAD(P)-dependent dehydrogenase (short-subunit alcohol dehydrogenase family)
VTRRTALVTGANRGIGLAAARELAQRGLDVVVAARQASDAEAAAQEVRAVAAAGVEVLAVGLDLQQADAVRACRSQLDAARRTVDVLVNNAGVLAEGDLFSTPEADFRIAMDVHLWGPLQLCREFVPGMLQRGYGRIVSVSSGWASFGEGFEGPPAYAISKVALVGMTLKLAQVLHGDVKANALCPGWVRTRMGGPGAPRSPEEGAETIVWLATLDAKGPNGGYFRDREPIPW